MIPACAFEQNAQLPLLFDSLSCKLLTLLYFLCFKFQVDWLVVGQLFDSLDKGSGRISFRLAADQKYAGQNQTGELTATCGVCMVWVTCGCMGHLCMCAWCGPPVDVCMVWVIFACVHGVGHLCMCAWCGHLWMHGVGHLWMHGVGQWMV